MDSEDEFWRTALTEFAARERGKLEDHPGDVELELYATKSLPASQLEEIRDHLVICPSCLSKALDQTVFPLIEPPTNAHELTDEQVEDRWQIIRSRLFKAFPEARTIPRRRRSVRRRALGLAVAAMLATVLIGFSFFYSQRISTNSQIVTLVPDEATPVSTARGLEGSAQTVSVLPSTDLVVLRLPVALLEEFPTYSIEIFEGDADKPRWQDSSIRRAEDLSFNVSFPRSALPKGNYRVQIWGRADADRRSIARFHFRVQNSE